AERIQHAPDRRVELFVSLKRSIRPLGPKIDVAPCAVDAPSRFADVETAELAQDLARRRVRLHRKRVVDREIEAASLEPTGTTKDGFHFRRETLVCRCGNHRMRNLALPAMRAAPRHVRS